MKSQKMNLTIAVAILLAFSTLSFAQTNGASAVNLKNQNGVEEESAQTIAATVLKKTYISSGSPFLSVPGDTFTPLDPGTTVTCPGPGTCTLVVDAWATSGGNSAAGNNRALVLYVDGVASGFGGAFLGEDATDGSFSAMTDLDAPVKIKAGKHTVSISAFSVLGDTVAFYRTIYKVYKP
jgi:hypothetical protein